MKLRNFVWHDQNRTAAELNVPLQSSSAKRSLAQRPVDVNFTELERASLAPHPSYHSCYVEMWSVSWPEDGPDGVLALQGRVLEFLDASPEAARLFNSDRFIWHSRDIRAVFHKGLCCCRLDVNSVLLVWALKLLFPEHYLFYILNEIW